MTCSSSTQLPPVWHQKVYLILVYINLEENNVGVSSAELLEDGGNHLAWPTPGSSKVNKHLSEEIKQLYCRTGLVSGCYC